MWKYFKKEEFVCHCGCGQNWINEDFITRLDTLREFAGFPFGINSGFRCPDHNDKVSSSGRDGPHTTGWAADIHTTNATQRYRLIRVAMEQGCLRLGWGDGFIHVDFCNELDPNHYPPEVFWDY